jgi:hypothetical protein
LVFFFFFNSTTRPEIEKKSLGILTVTQGQDWINYGQKKRKPNDFKLGLSIKILPQTQKLGKKKIANKWLKKGLGLRTLPQAQKLGQKQIANKWLKKGLGFFNITSSKKFEQQLANYIPHVIC